MTLNSTRREITGFSNPTVKYLRSLRDKKHRKAAGKFLAEGLRLLTDAREIRTVHLQGLGARAYGSLVRQYVRGSAVAEPAPPLRMSAIWRGELQRQ